MYIHTHTNTTTNSEKWGVARGDISMRHSRSRSGKLGVHWVWEITAGVHVAASTVVFYLSRVLQWVETLRRDMGGDVFGGGGRGEKGVKG